MRAVKRLKHRPVETFTDESGRHRFRVRARNGRVLASSRTYARRAGARRGAAALLRLLREAEDIGDLLEEEGVECSPTNS